MIKLAVRLIVWEIRLLQILYITFHHMWTITGAPIEVRTAALTVRAPTGIVSCKGLNQWFSNCGARPPRGGGARGLERGAQHTFLQIKIKTALNQLEK
jgi:hypothetical protein